MKLQAFHRLTADMAWQLPSPLTNTVMDFIARTQCSTWKLAAVVCVFAVSFWMDVELNWPDITAFLSFKESASFKDIQFWLFFCHFV